MGGTYPALSLYTGYVPLQVGMHMAGEDLGEAGHLTNMQSKPY